MKTVIDVRAKSFANLLFQNGGRLSVLLKIRILTDKEIKMVCSEIR